MKCTNLNAYTVWFFVCLLINYVKAALETQAIVGGDYSRTGQFKYQVSVQADRIHICGGGILDDYHILTAAHCVLTEDNSFDLREFSVVAGTINASLRNAGTYIRRLVLKAFVPSYYNQGSSDIAVFKLYNALGVNFHPFLEFLTLPQKDVLYPTYEGQQAIIAGYGYERVTNRISARSDELVEFPLVNSLRLKYGETTVWTNEACQVQYPLIRIVERHICAQMKQRQSESPEGFCSGDSGSPLVLKGTRIVIGIADSSPDGCNESVTPGLYTRVSSFVKFIGYAMNNIKSPTIASYEYKYLN